ncbi:Mu-like prophage major head subunit gpT family protein [Paenibacillus melissococcoides]|nr:Mu-like prophage major head subunit gpT family protein [Paenibacillus melissococcoides]CAH8720526.1 Mu-like prophage major head subunit gpT family protein [Paenibacillus melissococcoides]
MYTKAFEETKTQWEQVATKVPSTTGEENYKWLGKMPRMREWVGDREIQNLQASDYTIKNKDYELTVGVDRNDIEDDTIGLYNPIVQDMGQSAAAHPDELVFGLLLKGFKEKCYDKQPFFSDKHKIGEKVFSNKGTKKLSVRSYAAAEAP